MIQTLTWKAQWNNQKSIETNWCQYLHKSMMFTSEFSIFAYICVSGRACACKKALSCKSQKYLRSAVYTLHTFKFYFDNSGTACQETRTKKFIVVPSLCAQMNWEIVMHWYSIHDMPWRSNKKLINWQHIISFYVQAFMLSSLQLFTLCASINLEKHLFYWLSSSLCE